MMIIKSLNFRVSQEIRAFSLEFERILYKRSCMIYKCMNLRYFFDFLVFFGGAIEAGDATFSSGKKLIFFVILI